MDFCEQESVSQRVQYYLKFHTQGKLELGGPFLLPNVGGMVGAVKEVSPDEVETFTVSDPAMESGLLNYIIRLWLTAMEHE